MKVMKVTRMFLGSGLSLFSAMVIMPTPAQAIRQSTTARDDSVSEFKPAAEWDPLKANKDLEVGTFYFKKGNYDAAIDRFEEAARLHPGLAMPYFKLGETYEKTKNLPKAVESYRKYLELYKSAPDANSVKKKIEGLEKKMGRENEKHS